MNSKMEYGDFVTLLEHNTYIKTRMNAVSYFIGRFGCLSEEHWNFIMRAYADGFLKV